MRFIFGDRATFRIGNQSVPVPELVIGSAKTWFRENMRHVDPDTHVSYQAEIKPGSIELQDLFRREGIGANDTSAAVGYAPLSETETLVLKAERFLNSSEFKQKFPQTGEDVKVLGVRKKDHLSLTVAMPVLDRFVRSEKEYFDTKEQIRVLLEEHIQASLLQINRVTVFLNTLDYPGRGMAGMYLSVLGTSAEDGDSGEVGRGNRVNGLIALNRPAAGEAAAGKNAVSHVGKIYNVLASRIASDIYERAEGVSEAYVWMVSQIGSRIDQPWIALARINLKKGAVFEDVSSVVSAIMEERITGIGRFSEELLEGKYPVC